MPDIEDYDTNFFGSFSEYAQLQIDRIEQAITSSSKRRGDLDTHQFVYSSEVLVHIKKHFADRLAVKYVYCGDTDECDTHDGHLEWARL